MKHLLDCSNLPPTHPLNFAPNNEGVLGKFKNEMAGVAISEVVFLKPKMYSIMDSTDKCVQRAKGVKRNVLKRELKHERYVQVLRTKKDIYAQQRTIRPHNFTNYNVQMNKKALSCFCDKRFQLDEIRSVPYGYKGALPPPLSFFNIPPDFIV
jgi:hypothetical protein